MNEKQKRTIHYSFKATPEEDTIIQQKMKAAGIRIQSAFIRKMTLNGYLLKLDLPESRESVRLLGSLSNNVNQIARRLHEGDSIYETEVDDIVQNQNEMKAKKGSDPFEAGSPEKLIRFLFLTAAVCIAYSAVLFFIVGGTDGDHNYPIHSHQQRENAAAVCVRSAGLQHESCKDQRRCAHFITCLHAGNGSRRVFAVSAGIQQQYRPGDRK